MNDTLIPRGPEEEGFFFDNKIALSHRRLKFIDHRKTQVSLCNYQKMDRNCI